MKRRPSAVYSDNHIDKPGGAGRPKTGLPQREPITGLVEPEIRMVVDRLAHQMNISRSRLVEIAISDFLATNKLR